MDSCADVSYCADVVLQSVFGREYAFSTVAYSGADVVLRHCSLEREIEDAMKLKRSRQQIGLNGNYYVGRRSAGFTIATRIVQLLGFAHEAVVK